MRLRYRQQVAAAGVAVVALALTLGACSSSATTSAPGGGSSAGTSTSGGGSSNLSGTLNGSGSSFQLSFQQAALQAFKSVQSGMTVNFAGSDSPVPDKEASNFSGKTVLYFPVVIGPITMSYNLSGVSNLKLDAPVIAGIFSGKIKTWNDPAIKSLNSGVSLPSTSITLAVRSDSSGTTANFSSFLVAAGGSAWTLGTSSTINWPKTAQAGNGNGGVAQIVKSTPGAIGYVDYADAKASGLTFASVKNKDGNYIAPSTASATAAAQNATVKPDLTFTCIWAPGAQSYPITYQSWDLVFQAQSSTSTAANLKGYIGYLLGDGQKLLPSLNYAPLPSNIQQQAQAQLSKIGS